MILINTSRKTSFLLILHFISVKSEEKNEQDMEEDNHAEHREVRNDNIISNHRTVGRKSEIMR